MVKHAFISGGPGIVSKGPSLLYWQKKKGLMLYTNHEGKSSHSPKGMMSPDEGKRFLPLSKSHIIANVIIDIPIFIFLFFQMLTCNCMITWNLIEICLLKCQIPDMCFRYSYQWFLMMMMMKFFIIISSDSLPCKTHPKHPS